MSSVSYSPIPGFGTDDIVKEFGKGFAKILYKDGITKNLGRGPEKVKDAAWATAQYMAPRVENYMKTNAPWQDQTGNARSGLAARAYREADSIGIVLYHQVPYGIFLETRWDGRYSIIEPSIAAMGPEVMRMFDRLLERM